NRLLPNHHPDCQISSDSTTLLSSVCSTSMHHPSQNQSRHDHQIHGSLHTYMNSKPHDVAWKKHGNARVTHTMPCAFDSSPISITTPSSKLKRYIMLPLSQLISFSPKGSGKRSIPFYIANLKIFFLLLHLHPLADKFASFFTDKITKLHSSLSSTADSTLPHLESPTVPSKLTSFRLATADEISRLINQAPSKQCNLDPIPMSLLKQCCHTLAPVVTNIVNLSPSTGEFPSPFKQAIVTHLLKKPSLDRESLSNYRPISNLSFDSKLIERVIKDRLYEHLSHNSMFNIFQSAYTKFHSTESALLVIHDHKAMDR